MTQQKNFKKFNFLKKARGASALAKNYLFEVRRSFEVFVSRHIFNSPAWATHIITGFVATRYARMRYAKRTYTHPSGLKLREGELVHVEKIVDDKTILPIISEFKRAIEDNRLSVSGTNQFFIEKGVEAVRSLPNPEESLPSLTPILNDEIIDIVSTYFGCPFICLLVTPYRTYHVPTDLLQEKEALSDHWHVDNRRTDLMKMFILLEDVDETMGPFHALSKTQSEEAVRLGYRSRNNYGASHKWMESKARKLTGKMGDAMFCNTTLCLHRAGVPEKGKSRDQLELRFLPAASGPNDNWLKNMDLMAGY